MRTRSFCGICLVGGLQAFEGKSRLATDGMIQSYLTGKKRTCACDSDLVVGMYDECRLDEGKIREVIEYTLGNSNLVFARGLMTEDDLKELLFNCMVIEQFIGTLGLRLEGEW